MLNITVTQLVLVLTLLVFQLSVDEEDFALPLIRFLLVDYQKCCGNGLCCTNRVEDVLPLTPDGFSLQPLFGVCQVQ